MYKCLVCGYKGKFNAFQIHLKQKHGLKYTEYCKKFDLFEKCKWCGDSLGSNKKKDFCSKICRKRYENEGKYKDIPDMPYCRICGMKLPNPTSHLNRVHSISVNEYMKNFNLTKEDVFWNGYLKELSNNIKGEKNPAYNHGGKCSAFSKNFIGYKGLSEDEIDKRIKNVKNKAKLNKHSEDDNTKIDYYLKRYTDDIDEAKEMLRNRQITFSLDICIEKYGKEKGYVVWKERQNKWLDSLDKKSDKEKAEINKKKMPKWNGYSKISQELFWKLFNLIKKDFNGIYFATLDKNKCLDSSKYNNEYMIKRSDNKYAFLDFYIKDINKAIEFDGDYWHGEKRGNQERDMIRENSIIDLNPDMQILHIKERDYKDNPDKEIKRCLRFIYG